MKAQPYPEHIASTGSGALLQVSLLGGLALAWGDATLPLAGRSTPSLFAYLITYRHRAHTRDLLAGTFWPDLPDAQARRHLSQALWQIRRVLSPLPSPVPFILTDADTIQFNVEADYWLDVAEFERLVSWETGKLVNWETGKLVDWSQERATSLPIYQSTDLPSLRKAVELYRGDFMAGCYDDWTVIERERLREMYLMALGRLLELCKSRGLYGEALRYAQRLATEDPLREEGHREVMRLCHLLGRNNEALQQYELCQAILAEELGAEPTATTTALYREIAARIEEVETPYLPLTPDLLPSPLLEGTGQVPLVGRQRERTTLAGYLEQAFNGQGGMMLVEGEAGVGKTRLLQEVGRDAEWRGAQVLWGRGRELVELPPYGVLSEALRAGLSPLRAEQLAQLVEGVWLRQVSLILPQLAEWLPELPPHVALGPEQDRKRLLEALTRTVLALGQIAPHVLILEDLQWTDEPTLEALTHLTRRLAQSRVLVIGSCRGEEARERAAVWEAFQALDRAGCQERLDLSRLTGEESGELVRRGLGLTEQAPLFEARLCQETEGNPLFVLETLRALHDEGLLYRDPSGEWSTPWDETTTDYAELPLPPEVHQVIARRLARLGTDERSVLNTAAVVLGGDFDFALLLRAGNLKQRAGLAAVSELVRRRLLEEEPAAYRFSHDKVRQVAYMEIVEAERRRLHGRAGEALETLRPDRVESLALHFDRGGIRDKALTYTVQAGERATAVHDYERASAHYQKALALLGDDPATRWDVLARQEKVLNVLTRREAQADVLDEMLRMAEALDDSLRRARTRYRQGRQERLVGEPVQALSLLDEALRLARASGERKLVGEGLTEISNVYWRLGDVSRCQSAAEEALALFQEMGDREGERMALEALATLHQGLTGDYGKTLACSEEIRHIASELGDSYREAVELGNTALTRAFLGNYQTAQQALAEALAFIVNVGDRYTEGAFYVFQAVNYRGLGNLEKAQQSALRALEICRQVGSPNFELEALGKLGLVALDQGDPQQARDWFEQAAEVAEAHAQKVDRAEQLSHLALAESRLGNHETALHLSAQALSVMEEEHDVSDRLKTACFERAQIVNAAQGLQSVRPHLEHAYQLLMTVAGRISAPDLRRSFLENVAENRAIVAAHRLGHLPTRLRKQTVRMPAASAPTGRPLRDDEWVEVTWTVTAPEDDAVLGKVARRQQRLQRLLREAQEQGAAPTVDDLADALEVSRATIKRDLAALRRAGHEVRTRGSRNR